MSNKSISYALASVFLMLVWFVGAREAMAENKYKLTSKDPTAKVDVEGVSLDFYPNLRQMAYRFHLYYDDNFYKKGPHLMISFDGDGNRSRDINSDGAVNYYDFIDNILPIADVSNAKSNRYKGEGNVYLTNFQISVLKGAGAVKTVSGNLGTVNNGMQSVFGYTNKVCGDDDRYICIALDPLGPGDYAIAWNHPKVGSQVVATFTLSGPGGVVAPVCVEAGGGGMAGGGSGRLMNREMEAPFYSDWVGHLKSGKTVRVVLDVATRKFQDTPNMGAVNPMGTIKGGETYTVFYNPSGGWSATGYNKGTGGPGTWVYQPGTPDNHDLDIWGHIFKFSDTGEVFDLQHGLVGHMEK